MSARLRNLLFPLTPLYRLALALRERRLASGREPIRRLRFPVISIGNLSTGGAGKTPLTIALAHALTARGIAVDVLSRGYGRRSTFPARVDPNGSADDHGDEPLLIAQAANVPVYVAPQRYDAGLLAESDLQFSTQPTLVSPQAELAPPQVAQAELTPPQVAQAELTPPQVAQAELAPPQVAQVELAPPQVAQAELAPPQVAQAELTPPQVAQAELAPPQVAQAELAPPQVAQAELAPPQVAQAELAPPQVAQAELAPPQVAQAELAPPQVAQVAQAAGVKGTGFSPYTPSALDEGALAPEGIHLLDDGFQHRQLHRDLEILLINRADLDDHLLPAGNLREALHAAARAHILAIPATDPTLESDLRARGLTQPLWRLHRRMQIPPVDNPVLAFCGIARPEQFFAGLRTSNLDVAATRTFPDHHRYTAHDLDRLARQAQAAGATSLLTTEKDAVRLAGLASPLPIATVRLQTEIENAATAVDWILERLNLARTSR